jgi:hypothetical protein
MSALEPTDYMADTIEPMADKGSDMKISIYRIINLNIYSYYLHTDI